MQWVGVVWVSQLGLLTLASETLWLVDGHVPMVCRELRGRVEGRSGSKISRLHTSCNRRKKAKKAEEKREKHGANPPNAMPRECTQVHFPLHSRTTARDAAGAPRCRQDDRNNNLTVEHVFRMDVRTSRVICTWNTDTRTLQKKNC